MKLVALKLDQLKADGEQHGIGCAISPMVNSKEQCLHWCAWNAALQVIVVLPGVRQYMQSILAICPTLPLHLALNRQLEESAMTGPGNIEPLLCIVRSCTQQEALLNMAQQKPGGRLSNDVDCFELLDKLFCELHEEFMSLQVARPDLDEEASYWVGLLSMTCQERRRCTVAKFCGNRGDPVPLPWRPIAIEVASLISDASTSQLLCSVLLHHHVVTERDCIPCSAHQQKKLITGASTDRESGVVRAIRQAVHLPVMLLVSVWSVENVRGDAAATKDLGKSQELLQQPEPTKLSLKLEATIELEEYPAQDSSSRTMVAYRLVAIVFRVGGYSNGHFYMAAQSAPGSWTMYNSCNTSGPHSLDEIQAQHGEHVYGVAYLRKDMPVTGDRQSLVHWLQQPQNAEAARACRAMKVAQPTPAANLDAPPVQWAQAPLLAGVATCFSSAGSLSTAAASAGAADTVKQRAQPTSTSPQPIGMEVSLDLLLAKGSKKGKKPLQQAQRAVGAASVQQAASSGPAGRPSRFQQPDEAANAAAVERVRQLRAERKAEEAAKAKGEVHITPQHQLQPLAAADKAAKRAQRAAKKAAKQIEREEVAARKAAPVQGVATKEMAGATRVKADEAAVQQETESLAKLEVAAEQATAKTAATQVEAAATKAAAEQQTAAEVVAVATKAAAEQATAAAELVAALEQEAAEKAAAEVVAAAIKAAAEQKAAAEVVAAATKAAAEQATAAAVVAALEQEAAEKAAAGMVAAAVKAAVEQEAAERAAAGMVAAAIKAALEQEAAEKAAAQVVIAAAESVAELAATESAAAELAAVESAAAEQAAAESATDLPAAEQAAANMAAGPAAAEAEVLESAHQQVTDAYASEQETADTARAMAHRAAANAASEPVNSQIELPTAVAAGQGSALTAVQQPQLEQRAAWTIEAMPKVARPSSRQLFDQASDLFMAEQGQSSVPDRQSNSAKVKLRSLVSASIILADSSHVPASTAEPGSRQALAADIPQAQEGPAPASQQHSQAQDAKLQRAELPDSVPAGCHADAGVDGAEQLGGQTPVAAVGLWERSRQVAGQAVAEVAVATVVLPVVLPGLAVLHVPAGMWASACLARAACRNLLGL